MEPTSVNTVNRCDYTVPSFDIQTVDLRFELEETHTLVTNKMSLSRLVPGENLQLDGDDLHLESVCLDGKVLTTRDYQVSNDKLVIGDTPEQFELVIVTRIIPKENTQLMGLYRTHEFYCTQCEAEGFRRITYFLDRPDVLSKYKTTLVADKKTYPILLSNGNEIGRGELDGGRHWVSWDDPFKKPSYLFALVAGDLGSVESTYTTTSGRVVTLKIYTEHGNEEKCTYALEALKRAMTWDEEVYGLEYDLDIFMIVAVSDFNMGAMENKGLNIFNAKYILACPKTATDADYAGVEGVVAHEYFHNWTGNRITCRDWFQLSLKEGLTVFRDQEFSRDMNSRGVNRIQDVKVLRGHQFPEDAGPMAHPVRPESYIEINNFYTTTIYEKGAEVIRMQQTLLGDEGFQKGMKLYVERHDGAAVTIDDFVASMEDANHKDFSKFKRWYFQAGTPHLHAKATLANETLSLSLSQSCSPTPGQPSKEPFTIPVKFAVFSKEGVRYDLGQDLLVLDERESHYEFRGIRPGAVVSLLRDFSAPVALDFPQSDEDLAVLIRHETDGFARFEAMQQLLKNQYNQLIAAITQKKSPSLNNFVINIFKDLLQDKACDMALKAELLQPLSFEEVIADKTNIQVTTSLDAMDYFVSQIAEMLAGDFLKLYKRLACDVVDANEKQQMAARKLRNVCLNYLAETKQHESVIKAQYNEATNMTEELAAFRLLVNSDDKQVSSDAVMSFYQKWSNDELVLDKWFAILAMKKSDDALSTVIDLMSHKDFKLSNPNKVRALVGSFATGNPRAFHTPEGYQFLVSTVVKLDKLNPQIAAKLLSPMTRWRRYEENTQRLMKQSLATLTNAELSKDSFEIVTKALAD